MMPAAKLIWKSLAASRQGLLASTAYLACVILTAIWGFVFLNWNNQLDAEFDAKTVILDGLRHKGLGQNASGRRLGTNVVAVSAPTETVAASALQQYVLNRLEANGGTVQSIQTEPVPDMNSEGLQRLNAQLSFEGSVNSLQQILFDLEAGAPFVFVDALTIQPVSAAGGTRAGDRLRVTLLMSGYWLKAGTVGQNQ
jgi:general secretion pathway protein M